MTAALVLSGSRHYGDPWHPFAETSARIAELLHDGGIRTEISGDVDERMAELGVHYPDLLVLNIGDPALNFPDQRNAYAEAAARTGLLAYLAAGRPLLGVHCSSTSLRGVPEWRDIIGGVWVRGRSYHPDYGPLAVSVNRLAQPVTAGLDDFEVIDERYSDLSFAPGNVVIASQFDGALEHPLVWARSYGSAAARVVCDTLGHDVASFDSEGHRALFHRYVDWLLSRV